MNRRGVLGIVGAFVLASVAGGAVVMKPNAAKVTDGCCGSTCCSGAPCCEECCNPACCGDTCCCDTAVETTPVAKCADEGSCCEEDAQDGSACASAECPTTAAKS